MITRSSLPLVISILLSQALGPSANAQSPIYFWGLSRDCEQLASTNRQAEKQLHSASQSFALLHTPAGKPLPPCQGERCAQLLRQACPATTGRLLGGQVTQWREVTSFRLWLYDLSTGQIAYQDDYIQSLGLDDAFIAQAKALIADPHFGAAPFPKPTYCSQPLPPGGQTARTAAGFDGPLYLAVAGDGKHKAALQAALEQQLAVVVKKPLPAPVEARRYTLDTLRKMVAGQHNARVLTAESNKDGKVELSLYDQKTNLLYDGSASCPGCERDILIDKVQQAVSEMLEHCFGDQCAGSGVQPPVGACEPFPDKQCGGLDELLAPGLRLPARHIDSTTAKIVKGALWGLFAGSAATAIAKGLSGDILGGICLDMDKIDTQGLTTRGFNLMASPVNCAGWEVAANKLQPKNINTAGGGGVSCGLLLPSIPVDAKYSRVTLALIHQASLPSASQQARMEMFDTSSPLRIWVNPTTTFDQRTIIELDTAKLPSGPNAQASIQLGLPMNSAMPSWTISSIAVLGNP